MNMDYNTEIHGYYLRKCAETVAGMKDIVMLKTDCWNEVRLDVPGSGAIIGNVPNVKETYCVEVAPQRLMIAREVFAGEPVKIISGRIQDMEFELEMFDFICCLGTANYMGFPSAVKTLEKFSEWGWKLYLSAWLWHGKNQNNDSDKPGERFYHNSDDFTEALYRLFDVEEMELIDSSIVNYEKGNLVGFKCVSRQNRLYQSRRHHSALLKS